MTDRLPPAPGATNEGAVEQALCGGCKEIVPLTPEQIMVSGTKGWWHAECHETAAAEVHRTMALRAVAKMHGYVGQ